MRAGACATGATTGRLAGANGVAVGAGAAATGATTGAGACTAGGFATTGAGAGAAAAGAGAGAGAGPGAAALAAIAAALTAGNMSVVDIPHTPQKAAPRSTSEAHRGHLICEGGNAMAGAGAAGAGCIELPHIRQNLIPGGLSVAQREQRSRFPAAGAAATGAADGAATAGAAGAAAGGGGANGAWAGAGAGTAAGCAGGGAPMSRSFWPQSRQNNADGGFWRPQLLQFIAARFHYQQGTRVKE